MKKTCPRRKVQFQNPSGLFYFEGEPLSRTEIFEPRASTAFEKYRCGTCGRVIPLRQEGELMCRNCKFGVSLSPIRTTASEQRKLLDSIGRAPSPLKGLKSRPSTQEQLILNNKPAFEGLFETLMKKHSRQEQICLNSSRLVFPSREKVLHTARLQENQPPVNSPRDSRTSRRKTRKKQSHGWNDFIVSSNI